MSRKMVFGRLDYAVFISFFAYAAGAVVVPVALVSLARELGFSLESGGMTAGGALHLGRTLPMVVSMLLCGFAAGRWGKRRTFGWAVLLMGGGVALCALSPGYGMLFMALMNAGLGEALEAGHRLGQQAQGPATAIDAEVARRLQRIALDLIVIGLPRPSPSGGDLEAR